MWNVLYDKDHIKIHSVNFNSNKQFLHIRFYALFEFNPDSVLHSCMKKNCVFSFIRNILSNKVYL